MNRLEPVSDRCLQGSNNLKTWKRFFKKMGSIVRKNMFALRCSKIERKLKLKFWPVDLQTWPTQSWSARTWTSCWQSSSEMVEWSTFWKKFEEFKFWNAPKTIKALKRCQISPMISKENSSAKWNESCINQLPRVHCQFETAAIRGFTVCALASRTPCRRCLFVTSICHWRLSGVN